MVAPAAPAPFLLAPDRVEAFITALGDHALTIENIADDFHTTVGGLCLFLISPEGLALIADVELAMAVRIRVAAQALLPDVIATVSYVVREYAAEERRILMDTSMQRLKLLEHKRANARRAANLIVRLAHYTPQPLRACEPRFAPVRRESLPETASGSVRSSEPALPAQSPSSSASAPTPVLTPVPAAAPAQPATSTLPATSPAPTPPVATPQASAPSVASPTPDEETRSARPQLDRTVQPAAAASAPRDQRAGARHLDAALVNSS